MTGKRKNISVKTVAVVLLFIAAAILSAITMGRVAINYNLADYLGGGTQTKTALDILEDEFGMTGTLQVMAQNVTPETAEEMQDKIEAVSNVRTVQFDRYDETYYKDGNALFLVILDGDDYSANAKQAVADVQPPLPPMTGWNTAAQPSRSRTCRTPSPERWALFWPCPSAWCWPFC